MNKNHQHLLEIQKVYNHLPVPAQHLLDENIKRLKTIPHVGDDTALEVLWAVGRLLAKDEQDERTEVPNP